MGEGFTWETQDRERDVAAAEAAWAAAKEMIADEGFSMVILDEINIALRYEYLDIKDVVEGLGARPPMLHVIATGRNAHDDLIEAADLVTDMTLVKHPFRSGIKAQQVVAVPMLASLFNVSVASFENIRHGNMQWKYAALIATGAIIGGVIGAYLLRNLPGTAIRRSVGAIAVIAGLRMLIIK